MPTINQRAGSESIQAGVVEGNLNVNVKGKGLGAWGCFALSVVAIVAGIVGVTIFITRETREVIHENAPIVATAAIAQATVNASFAIPAYAPSASPVANSTRSSAVTPELAQFIGDFLGTVALLESRSIRESNDVYVAQVMTGEPLRMIQADIIRFKNRGVVYDPQFDFSASHFVNIRIINDNKIEVDSCEVWSGNYYNALNGAPMGTDPAHLVPQTVTIETTSTRAFITKIVFYDPPSFCR